MKPIYYFALSACVLFASCSTKNQVVKIAFNNVTHSPTFYSDKLDVNDKPIVIDKRAAVVGEDTDISVVVVNFNPLNHVFTLQQDPDALFYISAAAQPKVLTDFIAITNSTNLPNPDPLNATVPNAKCDIIDKLNTHESKLASTMNKFYEFHARIVSLNSRINLYKTYPTLDKDAFYCDIDNQVNKIKDKYRDATSVNAPITCISPYGPQFLSEGDEFVVQKDMYLKKMLELIEYIESDTKVNLRTTGTCNIAETTLSTSIDATVKKAKELREEIISKLAGNIDTVGNNLKFLATLQFEYYTMQAHVGETDELVLKLSVQDKIKNDVTIYPVAHLRVYKAMKIDYSAGVFISGLYDETYTKTVTTTTHSTTTPPTEVNNYKIDKLDGGALSYGGMGFVNLHTQTDKFFNYGISIGAGLRFNDSSKFVLGIAPGLYIGKNQRGIIHAGIALSQVDRIYSIYGEGSYTDSSYVSETKSIVKGSFFFGVSWNLSRTK